MPLEQAFTTEPAELFYGPKMVKFHNQEMWVYLKITAGVIEQQQSMDIITCTLWFGGTIMPTPTLHHRHQHLQGCGC